MQRQQGGAQANGGVAYEGATVIEPKRGYYSKPIATLDFCVIVPIYYASAQSLLQYIA